MVFARFAIDARNLQRSPVRARTPFGRLELLHSEVGHARVLQQTTLFDVQVSCGRLRLLRFLWERLDVGDIYERGMCSNTAQVSKLRHPFPREVSVVVVSETIGELRVERDCSGIVLLILSN